MRRLIVMVYMMVGIVCKSSGQFQTEVPRLFVDGNKNLLLTSGFQDSVAFANATIHGSPFAAYFLACLDSNFQLKWHRNFSLSGHGNIHDLSAVCDRNGNVYVGMSANYWVSVDSLTSVYCNPNPLRTIVIIKYAADGDLVWYRKSNGHCSSEGFNLGIDSMDNIYLATVVDSFFSLGGDSVFLTQKTGLVAKMDTSGTCLWMATMRGAKQIYDIRADQTGNAYITGTCTDTQFCGTDTILCDSNVSFVIKCAADGTPAWQRIASGPPGNFGISVDSGPNGSIDVTGVFRDSVRLGSLPTLFSSASGLREGLYVARLDSGGMAIRATAINKAHKLYNGFNHIKTDGGGNIYSSGRADESMTYVGDSSFSSFPGGGFMIKQDTLHNLLCSIKMLNCTPPHITIDKEGSIYLTGKMGWINHMFYTFPVIFNTDTFVHTQPGFYIARIDSACQLQHMELIISPRLPVEGLHTLVRRDNMDVWPNPSTGMLKINCGATSGKLKVSLKDMNGRLLLTTMTVQEKFELDISKQKPGVYILEVQGEKYSAVQLVVRE